MRKMGEERQGTCPVTAVHKLTYYLNVISSLINVLLCRLMSNTIVEERIITSVHLGVRKQ